ncbi:hypothetical protein D3C78_1781170 [compost metagenome]
MLAAIDIVLSGVQVGLFDEACNAKSLPQRLALLNIAKTGFGLVRLDTEGDEKTLLGQHPSTLYRCSKGFFVKNQVVCRHYQ